MGLSNRLIWHVNRTRLASVVKAGAIAFNWKEKMNRERVARSLQVSPQITNRAEELRRDGYSIIGDLLDKAQLDELAAIGAERLTRVDELASRQTLTHKKFWVRLLDDEMEGGALSADSIFVRFALQPNVTKLVASAMGSIPILNYVLLTASRFTDETRGYSQFWHRDHDDVKTIKLFTYLTDVTEDGDGPFTFLPRRVSQRFAYPLVRSHLRDEVVFKKVRPEEVRVVKAPRLATFVVETSSCLHMGSRMAQGHCRLLYTANFTSYPRIYPSQVRPFRAAQGTTDLERMLLDI